MKEHFEKFLGLGNASDNENDLLAYSYDASEIYGKAKLVLFPSSEEQLRLIFTYCNRNNHDVVLRGNGSNLTGMAVPQNSIVVSMQGFDRIHSLNVSEGWVKVDCGVTIAELNEALAEHSLVYALEPGQKKLRTIGGFLSENGLSRHSQRYGRAISTVRELDVMDATGKLFTVNKDLEQYIGNEGSVFAIIRATLRVITKKERSVDVHSFDTTQEAIQFSQNVMDEKPLSIEFLDAAAATYAGFSTRHTLLVEWEGDRGRLKYEQHAAMMQKRDAARKLLGVQGYIHLEDGTVEQHRLLEAIEWCRQKELPVIAHAGLGVVHPFLKREQEALRAEWYAWLSTNGQGHAGQFGYGTRKKAHVPVVLRNRIRQLKERYDYNNILGRGKLYDYV